MPLCFARPAKKSASLGLLLGPQNFSDKLQDTKLIHQNAAYIPGSIVPAHAEYPDAGVRQQKLILAASTISSLGHHVLLQADSNADHFVKTVQQTLRGESVPISSILTFHPVNTWKNLHPEQVDLAVKHLVTMFRPSSQKSNAVDHATPQQVQKIFTNLIQKFPEHKGMLQHSASLLHLDGPMNIVPRFHHDVVVSLTDPRATKHILKQLCSPGPRLVGSNLVERDEHDCNKSEGFEYCAEEKKCKQKAHESCEIVYSTPITSQVCWNGAAAVPPAPANDKHEGTPACIAFKPSYACEEWAFGGWKKSVDAACAAKQAQQQVEDHHHHHHHGHAHRHQHKHHHHEDESDNE